MSQEPVDQRAAPCGCCVCPKHFAEAEADLDKALSAVPVQIGAMTEQSTTGDWQWAAWENVELRDRLREVEAENAGLRAQLVRLADALRFNAQTVHYAQSLISVRYPEFGAVYDGSVKKWQVQAREANAKYNEALLPEGAVSPREQP